MSIAFSPQIDPDSGLYRASFTYHSLRDPPVVAMWHAQKRLLSIRVAATRSKARRQNTLYQQLPWQA